jgi:hypothetical protein
MHDTERHVKLYAFTTEFHKSLFIGSKLLVGGADGQTDVHTDKMAIS